MARKSSGARELPFLTREADSDFSCGWMEDRESSVRKKTFGRPHGAPPHKRYLKVTRPKFQGAQRSWILTTTQHTALLLGRCFIFTETRCRIEWGQVDAVHGITGKQEVMDRDHAIAIEIQSNKIGGRFE